MSRESLIQEMQEFWDRRNKERQERSLNKQWEGHEFLNGECSAWRHVIQIVRDRHASSEVSDSVSLPRSEYLMLKSEAQSTLGNNLCPDHRDKQHGKRCLACTIEGLESSEKQESGEVTLAKAIVAKVQAFLNHENDGGGTIHEIEQLAKSVIFDCESPRPNSYGVAKMSNDCPIHGLINSIEDEAGNV
jgi:hypothetical protein